jgi:hypothetical protein
MHYKDDTFRIIVHTANLVASDWRSKTQGVWMSPKLQKKNDNSTCDFEESLCHYLSAYKKLTLVENVVRQYDFSPCRVMPFFLFYFSRL